MNGSDAVGLLTLIFVVLCGLYGLDRITKPISYTKEEYEKRLKKGSGIARGTMNAMMYAVEELLHPKAVQAIHVERDMKAGYYDVQQENGNGFDEHCLMIPQAEMKTENPRPQGRANRIGKLLQSILNAFRLRR